MGGWRVVMVAIIFVAGVCLIVHDQWQTIDALTGKPLISTAKAAPVAIAAGVTFAVASLWLLVRVFRLEGKLFIREAELRLLKRDGETGTHEQDRRLIAG
ncbi:MAG: hypothetical protein HY340_02030 [Candidatus Kerfeldbacteria bacterium]|nr:hypothetical protein [Candidatus Kerfeldbacteria bacterium]